MDGYNWVFGGGIRCSGGFFEEVIQFGVEGEGCWPTFVFGGFRVRGVVGYINLFFGN